MKLIRYLDENQIVRHGIEQPDGMAEQIEGDVFGEIKGAGVFQGPTKLLAPVLPPAIFCIGMNYRRHADETGGKVPQYPVLFMKSPTALQNPGDPIEIPTGLPSEEVDYECELAVVIGKRCKNVAPERALEHVLGYTCANDVSARDWQVRRSGSQWCRAKTFDTFAPLGPRIVTGDEIGNPNALGIRTIVSGEVLQDWNTKDMIFDVAAVISFLSGSTTLLPGTVILTGTPHGVGMAANPPRWLKPGDTVTIEIEKIGQLTNPVALENRA